MRPDVGSASCARRLDTRVELLEPGRTGSRVVAPVRVAKPGLVARDGSLDPRRERLLELHRRCIRWLLPVLVQSMFLTPPWQLPGPRMLVCVDTSPCARRPLRAGALNVTAGAAPETDS